MKVEVLIVYLAYTHFTCVCGRNRVHMLNLSELTFSTHITKGSGFKNYVVLKLVFVLSSRVES